MTETTKQEKDTELRGEVSSSNALVMCADEMKVLGWHTWHAKDNWVHPDLVENPNEQDYTNYGMPLVDAIDHENNGRKPFKSVAHIQRAISALY